MALNFFVKFLVIVSGLKGFELQPTPVPQCAPEEVSAILDEYTNLLDETVNNSSLRINQLSEDVDSKITDNRESRVLLQILQENEQHLQKLTEKLCTEASKLKLEAKVAAIKSLKPSCALKSNSKQISIKEKLNQALLKAQSTKPKASLALQKCGSKKAPGDCSAIATCCQQSLLKSTSKIDSAAADAENRISVAAAAYNSCLNSAIREELNVEASLKAALIECKLQELDKSDESSESNESGQKSEEVTTESGGTTENGEVQDSDHTEIDKEASGASENKDQNQESGPPSGVECPDGNSKQNEKDSSGSNE